MRRRSHLFVVMIGLLLAAVPVHPHHAVSEVYDESQTMILEGDIVTLVYRNPHSLIHLEVSGRRGTQRTWAIELRGLDRLRGRGSSQLQPGDHVIVCGNPGRDPGQFRMQLLALSRPADGAGLQVPDC